MKLQENTHPSILVFNNRFAFINCAKDGLGPAEGGYFIVCAVLKTLIAEDLVGVNDVR